MSLPEKHQLMIGADLFLQPTQTTMNDTQAWLTLLLAITAEITGTALLKLSVGLTRPWPTTLLLGAYACAIALVARVANVIPLGITYALWSAIGTLAVVLIGALGYRQVPNSSQLIGIALIVTGVVIVNLGGRPHA
jgi:small multidrug resistance pump